MRLDPLAQDDSGGIGPPVVTTICRWGGIMYLRCVNLLAALVAGLSLVAAPAVAQTTSASVTGTVVDASRAVMPGVTVTLTSKSQGDVMTAVSSASPVCSPVRRSGQPLSAARRTARSS